MFDAEAAREIPRVSVELSNRCNYACFHKRCPTSTFDDVRITPLSVVLEIIRDLAAMGWGEGKTFAFHVYNEPSIDPRLYWLIDHVVRTLPGVKPFLATNGWYMDGGLMQELIDVGLSRATISIYSKDELNRLKPQVKKMPQVRLHIANLKRKLLEPGDGPKRYRRCFAPICDLTVRAPGLLGLCCLDWKREVVFGDLGAESLKDVLERRWDEMVALQNDLRAGRRKLPVCRLCHRRRASNPQTGM